MVSTPTKMLEWPGSNGFAALVGSPVAFSFSACGAVVAEISSRVSTVDSVVKLKVSTMLAGFRLLASAGIWAARAAAICRCAPVSWHTPFRVGSVMLGQVGPPASAVLMAA